MAKEYQYLISGLPEVQFEDNKLSLTSNDLRDILKEELSKSDYKLIEALFLEYDNQNLLNILFDRNKDFNNLGNYQQKDFETALGEYKGEGEFTTRKLENYFYEIIQEFLEAEEKNFLDFEKKITKSYYEYISSLKNIYLKDYLMLKKDIKNILIAIQAKKYNLAFTDEIMGEDQVAEAIKNSNAKDFGIGDEYEFIDEIISISSTTNLMEREKKLDKYLWNYLEVNSFFHYFDIERVITYLLGLMMVERWIKLDPVRGKEEFKDILSALANSYEFPKEYVIK